MSVTAKFKCESITEYETSKQVKFRAVYGTAGENAHFTKYTPAGEISVTIDKDSSAADEFNVGENYYVSFAKAPK